MITIAATLWLLLMVVMAVVAGNGPDGTPTLLSLQMFIYYLKIDYFQQLFHLNCVRDTNPYTDDAT